VREALGLITRCRSPCVVPENRQESGAILSKRELSLKGIMETISYELRRVSEKGTKYGIPCGVSTYLHLQAEAPASMVEDSSGSKAVHRLSNVNATSAQGVARASGNISATASVSSQGTQGTQSTITIAPDLQQAEPNEDLIDPLRVMRVYEAGWTRAAIAKK